ncbi:Aromatic acid exporter family member 1 [Carboxydocella sporoproducens DSM 16521]|uniref:Aromatic acid exporter family member 1 n=2 Tax=Carboxydocella TaxID=178898 RepID=A0A1T4S098_9FIRM|nr:MULTISPECIES: aromatic acid exporter family protein [Carboxydocella]AVX21123.1 Aromatic acid exporter family member 1 [Carboxydocella thermautotrophica]AVX31558.1 Aromatic acid exporter family member 1 [Carboxydocella thermautotrophica]SKA21699.1 Aromatic acid exporter family member 1 [Carboxydocella sporoproducens DSM 16521]
MIGKRIIKTAIAAALTMVIARIFHLDYPFYAVIAVIVVMQSTLGSSLDAGINRLLGTVVGAITGALAAISLGSTPWALGLGLLVTIYLCNLLGLVESISIAGIVLTAVVLEQATHPWVFAWGRFLDTMMGIFVAWLVNALLWPPRLEKVVRTRLSEVLLEMAELVQQLATTTGQGEEAGWKQWRQLGEKISSTWRFWQENRREMEQKLLGDDHWQLWFDTVESIYHNLLILQRIGLWPEGQVILRAVGEELRQAARAIAVNQRPGLKSIDLRYLAEQAAQADGTTTTLGWQTLLQIARDLQKL